MFYKLQLLLLLFIPMLSLAQASNPERKIQKVSNDQVQAKFVTGTHQLTLEAALELTHRAREAAKSLNKEVSIAIVDASGQVMALTRGNGVGPHNTEAARRKAYTSLSTKTPTLLLARNAKANADTENLVNLPELLLLGGGCPIWHNGQVIGGIGVAGGDGPENDHNIAKAAAIEDSAILIH
ncbi:heme-binding protein [Pontibacter sp. BT731]|uniref:heme-binding protein n=1 Tax=Pontibacter coccineus TaxID=3063328 RepID=UPI0026E41600|nr:heme-binding protein [Pontibacter sp. BT731]MDO6391068.1 heme-binding protein [Pontibacter sp. BT731]